MSVCAAESLLRYKRVMSEMDRAHTDREAPHGGREVIPRLTAEDQEAQIAAVRAGTGIVPMGYRKG
jgi:plasmid stabilization system protein ParE